MRTNTASRFWPTFTLALALLVGGSVLFILLHPHARNASSAIVALGVVAAIVVLLATKAPRASSIVLAVLAALQAALWIRDLVADGTLRLLPSIALDAGAVVVALRASSLRRGSTRRTDEAADA